MAGAHVCASPCNPGRNTKVVMCPTVRAPAAASARPTDSTDIRRGARARPRHARLVSPRPVGTPHYERDVDVGEPGRPGEPSDHVLDGGRHPGVLEQYRPAGLTARSVGGIDRLLSLGASPRLVRVIPAGGYDIVVSAHLASAITLAALAAHLARWPVVTTFHTLPRELTGRNPLHKRKTVFPPPPTTTPPCSPPKRLTTPPTPPCSPPARFSTPPTTSTTPGAHRTTGGWCTTESTSLATARPGQPCRAF